MDPIYATLFFATYDNDTQRLTYANCGHNPPLLLRGGEVQWLAPTAPVLGLFEEWTCVSEEVELRDGHILVLFTDGITEATGETGESTVTQDCCRRCNIMPRRRLPR